MRIIMSFMLFILAYAVHAFEDFDRSQIEQRIKPLGQVRLEEDATQAQAAQAIKTEEVVKKDASPGKKIYDQYCHVCHQAGVAGAPKFQNAADWKTRTAGKSLDDLLAISKKGLNAMPAKGTCMDCSDADLKAAIQYMLPKS